MRRTRSMMVAVGVMSMVAMGCVEPPPAPQPSVQRLTNGNGQSWGGSISADGGWVVFASEATDLTPEVDLVAGADLYLANTASGDIARITNTTDPAASFSNVTVSAHGEAVVFRAIANNMFGQSYASAYGDVFHWHRDTDVGTHLVDGEYSGPAMLSADGELAFFRAVVPPWQVSRGLAQWTRASGTVSAVTSSNAGVVGGELLSVSAYGSKLTVSSERGDLNPSLPDDDGDPDLFILDFSTGVLERLTTMSWDPLATNGLSIAPYGGRGVNSSGDVYVRWSSWPSMTAGYLYFDGGTGEEHTFSPPIPEPDLNDGHPLGLLENGNLGNVDATIAPSSFDVELLELNPLTGHQWSVMSRSLEIAFPTPSGWPLFPMLEFSADGHEMVLGFDAREDDVAVDNNGGFDVFAWSAGQ